MISRDGQTGPQLLESLALSLKNGTSPLDVCNAACARPVARSVRPWKHPPRKLLLELEL